jgi:hypothetical protein
MTVVIKRDMQTFTTLRVNQYSEKVAGVTMFRVVDFFNDAVSYLTPHITSLD